MSEKKELNQEQLEKVSGGEEQGLDANKLSYLKIYYKENGVEKNALVSFQYNTLDRTFEEDQDDAKDWCEKNGLEYLGCERVAPIPGLQFIAA